MKISAIRFGIAVMCGTTETNFIKNDLFDITKEGIEFTITHKQTGMESKTTVHNAAWWKEVKDSSVESKPKKS